MENTDAPVLHRSTANSTITYLDTYIHQPDVEKCLQVKVIFDVKDENGEPVLDAVVNFNGMLNTSGDYIFEGIVEGTYPYKIVKEGYTDIVDEVMIFHDNSEQIVTVSLALETFNISFNVLDEKGEEITDAVVTFDNIQNIPGDYLFGEIEAGVYNYKVEREWYNSVEGQVGITQDTIVDITLVALQFTIIFDIEDIDENEIADAVVTFNGIEHAAGDYIFDGVTAGTYDYMVQKEGYITVDEQYDVRGDDTVKVKLTTENFTISFNIEDIDGEPILDAVVTFDGVKNSAGDYTFNGINEGTYAYRVERDGYISIEDQHEVTGDDTVKVILALETFTISFKISDIEGKDITDAIVTFDGVSQTEGSYTFDGISAGNYNYSVEKDEYSTVNGEHEVTQDTTLNVTLLKETFTVTFNIQDNQENEITNAVVTLNGKMNDSGDYVFEGVEPGVYNYKVEKEGYESVEDEVEVVDQDLNVGVVLIDSSTNTFNLPPKQWVRIIPNPNTGKFILELNPKPAESEIRITIVDPTGKVIYQDQDDWNDSDEKKELNLSLLHDGIYYIRVQGNHRTDVKKLIINQK